MRAREMENPPSHQDLRNEIVREYYGLPSYVTLVNMMNKAQAPERVIPRLTGGLYECATRLGKTISYQTVLEVVGHFCAGDEVRLQLVNALNKMGDDHFDGSTPLRAGTAAWRIYIDCFDRVFVLLFDHPAGQVCEPDEKPGSRLNLALEDHKVVDMHIAYV